jgi:hypothetical protein
MIGYCILSFDSNLIVTIEVLILVLLAFYILIYNFSLIGESISGFGFFWFGLSLLKDFIKIWLLLVVLVVNG